MLEVVRALAAETAEEERASKVHEVAQWTLVSDSQAIELLEAADWHVTAAMNRWTNGKRRCWGCSRWTASPILPRDRTNPHIACSLKCLGRVNSEWITLKHEMREMDTDLIENRQRLDASVPQWGAGPDCRQPEGPENRAALINEHGGWPCPSTSLVPAK